ncbi:MAG: hypothetical protein M1828_004978 [Chrysothrix sp. TS-e1954]|nr:MAG: hypothetical protein M1828_004978 [Chrysothrix sp. TS-e1954]
MATASLVVAKVLAFLYGLQVFSYLSIRAIWEGYVSKRPSKRFWRLLEEERTRLWNLALPLRSLPNFTHAFLRLPNSSCHNIHFITNTPPSAAPKASGKPLLVLLHGWPDNPHMYTRSLTHLPTSFSSSTTIIAPSLPGFGASDSVPSYSVNNVMNAIAEFVLLARETYQPSRVILCGHDWGGLVAGRLLGEDRAGDDGVGWLVDAGVLGNTAIPAHANSNVADYTANFSNIFRAWTQTPSSYRLLRSAGSAIRPLAAQVARSGYVFLFNLPRPLVGFFIDLGGCWFLRVICVIALGQEAEPQSPGDEDAEEIQAHYLAGILGPGVSVLDTCTPDGDGYPEVVQKRIKAHPNNPHTETIRYYREGLVSGSWTLKSAALLDSPLRPKARQPTVVDEADERIEGRLKVPVEFVWGEGDPALDERICLRGVERYLGKGSGGAGGCVRRVEKGGHWFLSREEGSKRWAEVVVEMVREAVGEES